MINLTSLSALIRSLRHTSGIDAPALPVPRVASVAPVAEDDAGTIAATLVRTSTSPRMATAGLEADGAERSAARPGRDVGAPLTGAPTAAASRPAVAANSPTVEPPRSAALDFTDGARLLQAALRGSGLRTPMPPAITSELPLVLAANTPAHELARGLANAVTGSGLFYESHLARALQRDYPAAALAREPQSSWAAPTAMSESTANPATLPEAASSMLTRQLDALDTRALLWTGDVWPGQRATIAFAEQERARDAANDADVAPPAAAWKLRLSIDMPTLGRVQVTLDLRADVLDITLAAQSGETQRRLAGARDALSASLDHASLALGRFDVRPDPS